MGYDWTDIKLVKSIMERLKKKRGELVKAFKPIHACMQLAGSKAVAVAALLPSPSF